MQIVEANDYGVRVAELRLKRRGSPMQFVLYPMLHVGDRAFYVEVTKRLRAANFIVVEGMDGPSRIGDQLTANYRRMAADERLGLVVQHLGLDELGIPLIRPDMSGPQFDARWQTLPRRQRGAMWAAGKSFTAAQRLLGSRFMQLQLKDMSLDDLPSQTEILASDLMPDLDRILLDERDELLVAALDSLHREHSHESITVAVVYGAFHMRAVVIELSRRHGYVVGSGDWLTAMVF